MTSTINPERGRKPSLPWYRSLAFCVGLGILAMLVVWQVLSMVLSQFIVASPAATFQSLVRLAADGSLWQNFAYSLVRLLIGLAAGAVIGITLGILSGLNSRLRAFLEPLRWTVMTVPAIIISVLAMLWFGIGSIQVVFMIGVITMPISYVNTLEGMLSIDASIIEMSTVYRIPPRLRLTEIYLPGIGSAVMAGLTLASGIGVRAAILAEFIGARNGIGHSLFLSWTFLDTPALFAWIIMAFVLLGLVEFAVLKPVRDYLMRWKRTV
ncbi:MAG: ABC transporter permease [Dehalococcoidales bacterium]|nr:ABC transporter permease [Dehalococcoidales bacterium]